MSHNSVLTAHFGQCPLQKEACFDPNSNRHGTCHDLHSRKESHSFGAILEYLEATNNQKMSNHRLLPSERIYAWMTNVPTSSIVLNRRSASLLTTPVMKEDGNMCNNPSSFCTGTSSLQGEIIPVDYNLTPQTRCTTHIPNVPAEPSLHYSKTSTPLPTNTQLLYSQTPPKNGSFTVKNSIIKPQPQIINTQDQPLSSQTDLIVSAIKKVSQKQTKEQNKVPTKIDSIQKQTRNSSQNFSFMVMPSFPTANTHSNVTSIEGTSFQMESKIIRACTKCRQHHKVSYC